MIEIDNIYNCDCLEGMKQIPDGTIDLIATDPPYEFVGNNEKYGGRGAFGSVGRAYLESDLSGTQQMELLDKIKEYAKESQ